MVLTVCFEICRVFRAGPTPVNRFERAVTESIKRGVSKGKVPQAGVGLQSIHMIKRLASIGKTLVKH